MEALGPSSIKNRPRVSSAVQRSHSRLVVQRVLPQVRCPLSLSQQRNSINAYFSLFAHCPQCVHTLYSCLDSSDGPSSYKKLCFQDCVNAYSECGYPSSTTESLCENLYSAGLVHPIAAAVKEGAEEEPEECHGFEAPFGVERVIAKEEEVVNAHDNAEL